MDAQRQVLLVGYREEWLENFRKAIGNYPGYVLYTGGERPSLPADSQFEMALIDLWLDASLNENDADSDGTHDALEIILDLSSRYPKMRILVVGEAIGREALQNTPGVPRNLLYLAREQYEPGRFGLMVQQLLTGNMSMSSVGLRPVGQTTILPSGPTPPSVGSRPGRPRILIIEDQPFWQDTLARLMEEENFFWRIAPNADQAMARLQLESFHVALFNLALGDRGGLPRERQGWSLLDYITTRCPKTRLMVISGHLSSTDVARLFMGFPIKGFIDKNTFNRADLLLLIQQQVNGPTLKIKTLGDFRILRDGKLISSFGNPLAELAIKVLLTRGGETVSVDEMIQYLWPGADRKSRNSNLAEVINAARLALEPDIPRASDSRLIVREGSGYRFDITANVEIDSEQLKRLVERARHAETHEELAQALDAYKAATQMYHGDYLATDRGVAWTMQERTALQVLYTESLNRMADLYAREGEMEMAIKAANQALQTDPYVEGTYRRLMRYHACRGDKTAALGVYRALVKLFGEFIDEELNPATQRLYNDIEAGLPSIAWK